MINDAKTRALAIQIALFALIVAVVALLVTTAFGNLRARGMPIGFDFLTTTSRLVISESLLSYEASQPYYWAILVGIVNTLFISMLVILFSTVLGLVVGLGRLSGNPLVAATCKVWVEIARNFPPLVLLIFLYSLWWKVLPVAADAIALPMGSFVSMRGMNVPAATLNMGTVGGSLIALAMCFLAVRAFTPNAAFWRPWRRWQLPAVLALFSLGLWIAQVQITLDMPQFTGSNFEGGIELSPELSTILVGLTVYTTGFVAEIIRGGVLSIDRGQWEAGRSLGLSRAKILRLIVVPQTLRVIVPPLNSQYINVVKNSTLAIAVGYPDFFAIMNTTISKSSHAIEGIFIILCVYLVINLGLSSLANWFNRRIAIIER